METERQRLARRFTEVKAVRANGWEAEWKDAIAQILPYRSRFLDGSEHNRGRKKSGKIINSAPTRSLRILCAGLMAGITSPSRIWFRLTTKDKTLREKQAVKVWLAEVEDVLREMLATGGFYQSLADGVYADLGMVSSGAMWEDEARDGGIKFVSMTPGQFWIDVDGDNRVDTVFHERPWQARHLVRKYGLERCSEHVKTAFNNGQLSTEFKVVHAVYPNDEWSPGKLGQSGMRWASRRWESDAPADAVGAQFLEEGGYYEFPLLCPRWRTLDGETYGRGSPGWEALPDCKTLQHREVRLASLVDKMADPPMKAPESLRDREASLLPGDLTYLPAGSEGGFYEPAQLVDPRAIEAVKVDIGEVKQRIEQAFFVDLWLAMLTDNRATPPTATEVEITHQEVMLQLGPLLENLNHGLLEPCIVRTFGIAARQGAIPPPPPELEGSSESVEIEFISVMHKAQKLTNIVGLREFGTQLAQLAGSGFPEVLDKIDSDKIVDELAEILGIRPEIVRTDEQVEARRKAKAARQQAAEQGEALATGARAIKDASGADPAKLQDLAATMAPAAGGNWGAG